MKNWSKFKEEYTTKTLELETELWKALSPAARRVIYRLARAHGHAWTAFTTEQEAREGLSIKEIAQRTCEKTEIGIEKPNCYLGSEYIYSKHTTKKTLEWEIYRDIFTLKVSRPSGEFIVFAWRFEEDEEKLILTPHLSPFTMSSWGGQFRASGYINRREDGGAIFCKRHYKAVMRALAGIVDEGAEKLIEHAPLFHLLKDHEVIICWAKPEQVMASREFEIKGLEEQSMLYGENPVSVVACHLPVHYTFEWAEGNKECFEAFTENFEAVQYYVEFVPQSRKPENKIHVARERSGDKKRLVEASLVDGHTERYDIYQWYSSPDAGGYKLVRTIETPALEGELPYKIARIEQRARILAAGGKIY